MLEKSTNNLCALLKNLIFTWIFVSNTQLNLIYIIIAQLDYFVNFHLFKNK